MVYGIRFYEKHSPMDKVKAKMIASEWQQRGAIDSELQDINTELRNVYGEDLSSVVNPAHVTPVPSFLNCDGITNGISFHNVRLKSEFSCVYHSAVYVLIHCQNQYQRHRTRRPWVAFPSFLLSPRHRCMSRRI